MKRRFIAFHLLQCVYQTSVSQFVNCCINAKYMHSCKSWYLVSRLWTCHLYKVISAPQNNFDSEPYIWMMWCRWGLWNAMWKAATASSNRKRSQQLQHSFEVSDAETSTAGRTVHQSMNTLIYRSTGKTVLYVHVCCIGECSYECLNVHICFSSFLLCHWLHLQQLLWVFLCKRDVNKTHIDPNEKEQR